MLWSPQLAETGLVRLRATEFRRTPKEQGEGKYELLVRARINNDLSGVASQCPGSGSTLLDDVGQ